MNRSTQRTLSLLALATSASLGIASLLGLVQGGCVYGSNETPQTSQCNAMAGYYQGCNVSAGCAAAYEANCTKIASSMSAAAVNAVFNCVLAGDTCGDAGSGLVSACTREKLGSSVQSPAQAQLASDYCKACVPENTTCANGFYFFDAGAAGDGLTSLALSSDTTVQTIDTQCTPGLSLDAGFAACAAAFNECATPLAAAGFYLPPECLYGDAGVP